MNPTEYIQNVVKTESNDFKAIYNRLNTVENLRLLHGAIGVSTESGELLDAIKKMLYYGKPLDKPNLLEEIGDMLWYIAILCDTLKFDFEKVMQQNIEKLKTRYPNKFNSENAINRNLENERKILEK